MGGKDHDYYTIPLCHEGANNCHKGFDAYEILNHRREELRALGVRLHGVTGNREKGLLEIARFKHDV